MATRTLEPVALETADGEPGGPAALPAERHGQRGAGTQSRVLVLNASYEPINVCTVRRAVVLVLKQRAEVLERSEWALHSENLTVGYADGVLHLTIPVSPTTRARRVEITHAPGGSRSPWGRRGTGVAEAVLPSLRRMGVFVLVGMAGSAWLSLTNLPPPRLM